MNINTPPTATLDATYKLLKKYIRTYVESGELGEQFKFFEGDEMPFGTGAEISLILSANGVNLITSPRNAEHGNFPPNTVCAYTTTEVKEQYSVTIDYDAVKRCVGSEDKVKELASEYVQSLYQGHIDLQNTQFESISRALRTRAYWVKALTLGTDVELWAKQMIATINGTVSQFRLGVDGTTYGNAYVGTKKVASKKIAIIINPVTKAMLDAFGFASVMTPEFMEMKNCTVVECNGVAENSAVVTDARNVIKHKVSEVLVELTNSDGSENEHLTERYIFEPALATDGSTAVPLYPLCAINSAED